MAVSFDGVDDVLQLAGESTLRYEYTQAFSGHAWIRKPSETGFCIMGKAQNSPPGAQQRGWAFNTEAVGGGGLAISFHLVNNGGSAHAFAQAINPTNGTLKTGVWVPVGFTYTGSGTTAGMKLYIGGVPITKDAGSIVDTLSGGTILVNGVPLRLGGFDSEFWAGDSCGIVLVPGTLTDSEMAALADIRNIATNPNTFLTTAAPDVWLPLSGDAVADYTDYSGNGHNASVSSGAPAAVYGPRLVWLGNKGSGTLAGTSSQITFTTTDPIPAGSLVVLGDSHLSGHGNITAVTVGALSLAFDKREVITGVAQSEIWSGLAQSLIPAGTTVTVTYTTSTSDAALATLDAFGGNFPVSGRTDKTSGAQDNASTATTFDTGTPATTVQADEVAYAVFTCGLTATDPIITPQAGWTESKEAVSASLHIEAAFKILTATGTPRHQPTSSVGQSYAGSLATYLGSGALGTQLLLASADSVDGTWTDQAGGTALSAAIDETVPSDTDYIQSVDSPSNAGCRVKLATGADPSMSTGHVLHWRVKKSAAGQVMDMTIKLYQGGGNSLGAGTLIATRTRSGVTTSFQTFDETLTGTEADSITNYGDLYLEFYATAS